MPSTTGMRRTRVAVQARTDAVDALGQPIPSWSTVATLWGCLRPASGRELAVAGQTNALLSHVVETRWPGSLVTVTPSHRLLVGSRVLSITWVDNPGQRNKDLFIGCVERVSPTGD